MKKFVKYLLVLCLMVPFAFMFAGCGEPAPSNVMTMSVNPKVSFVLDANNNIASVKYENEDASKLYANVDFVGKDVNLAVKLFIEQATISGHVELNGDNVSIDISGKEDVTALKEQVKTQVENVFESLGVQVNVVFENVTKEAQRTALETTAKALAPEKTENEIKNMTNDQLVKLINDKQVEYKDLAYSQVEKVQADLESGVQKLLQSAKETFEKAEEALKQAQKDLDEHPEAKQIYQPLLDGAKQSYENAKTLFNQQVENFQQAKKEAIAAAKQKYAEIKSQLIATFKNEVQAQKTVLIAHLDVELQANHITQEQYDYWVNLINSQLPQE